MDATTVHSLDDVSDGTYQHLPQDQAQYKQQKSNTIQSQNQPPAQRRRISRACDQCNQFRTRCDGKLPCKRCSDLVLNCDYARQMKKRGKGSNRYASNTAARSAAAAAAVTTISGSSGNAHSASQSPSNVSLRESPADSHLNGLGPSVNTGTLSNTHIARASQIQNVTMPSQRSPIYSNTAHHVSPGSSVGSESSGINTSADEYHDISKSTSATAVSRSASIPNGELSEFLMRHINNAKAESAAINGAYLESLEEITPEIGQMFQKTAGAATAQDQGPTASIFVQTPGTSTPRWFNIRSPFPASLSAFFASTPVADHTSPSASADTVPGGGLTSGANHLQHNAYPVLAPILPYIDFISPSLAADLMAVYYSNTIYGVAHFTRKSSVLTTSRAPRTCSKALLFSFMYMAAHVSDHPDLTVTPTSRTDIISKLYDLTIQHLQPLIYSDRAGTLDDVMTYIHLGIISSASEFKGASLRWWHAAVGLARVLKLNVEMKSGTISEETREERRRVWWLLFLVDRHLGLCYNRPISVLEHETYGLYQPCRDDIWFKDVDLVPAELDPSRARGIPYTASGPDIWGYFLPLMALLGGVVELHILEMSEIIAVPQEALEMMRNNVRVRLNNFIKSVDEYEQDKSLSGDDKFISIQKSSWKEYCRCLIHVMHIIVSGYCDPIDILSLPHSMVLDSDFVNVIQHALDFAKTIKRILELDPDLRMIPFFFGIHMLQGSFTLLYVVDVLGDREVRAACETIVRAHEVCIVTLNTEYQRNFRQIMRGALQMIDVLADRRRKVHVPHNNLYGGSPPEEIVLSEIEDSKRRRRNLLSLYRWSRGGNGLAV
ncbi:fungal-specific transcription factor domain-containing protein [Dipodascopsis uninucleata]